MNFRDDPTHRLVGQRVVPNFSSLCLLWRTSLDFMGTQNPELAVEPRASGTLKPWTLVGVEEPFPSCKGVRVSRQGVPAMQLGLPTLLPGRWELRQLRVQGREGEPPACVRVARCPLKTLWPSGVCETLVT